MPQEFFTDEELDSYRKSKDEPTGLLTDDELDELIRPAALAPADILGKKGAGRQFVEGLGRFPRIIEKMVTPKTTLDKYGRKIPYLPEVPETEPKTLAEKAARMAGSAVSFAAGMPLGVAVAPASIPAGMAIGAAENVVASGLESVADDVPLGEAAKRMALDAALGAAIPGGIGMAARGVGRRLARTAAEAVDGGTPKAAAAAVIGDAESALPAVKGLEELTEEVPIPARGPSEVPPEDFGGVVEAFKNKFEEDSVVTVYHGRGGMAGAGAGDDWFTTNPQRAASFAGEEAGDLMEVQVPRDVFEAGKRAAREAGSGTPGDVVLPPEWVGKTKPSKVERTGRLELDDSFDFSLEEEGKKLAKKLVAEREAPVLKAKPLKGFDPERHSISDAVALEGGLNQSFATAEGRAMDLDKMRATVGPGNRQYLKEGGVDIESMIQRMKEQGFYRMNADVTHDQFWADLAGDIAAKGGEGRGRAWSNLKQGFEEISDVGTGRKSIFEGEEGSAFIFNDLLGGVRRAVDAGQVKAEVKAIFRTWGRSYEGAVKKMGPEGAALANRVKGYRTYAEPRVSSSVARYKRAIKGLSDAEFGDVTGKDVRGGSVIAVLELGHKPTNARVARAANEIRKLTDDVVRQARVFGWDIGELENYFPHRFDRKLLVPDALRPVPGGAFLAHKRAKTYNLERSREKGVTGYRRDRGVLEEYFVESYKQLGELAYFGRRRGSAAPEVVEAVKAGLLSAKQAKVMKKFYLSTDQHAEALNLIGQITSERGRRKALEGFMRLTGNVTDTTVDHTLALVRNVNALISLSTSAIPQTTQAAHIFSEVGGRSLLRGLKDVVTDFSQARFRAELSGAVFPNYVNELQKAHGGGGRFMWGLGVMDRNLRVLADASGRQWVTMLEKQAAKGSRSALKNLEALGIRGGRKAIAKDFDRIGKLVADTTQFRADVVDMPVAMTHPVGKTVTQFMSFMYAHAKWLTMKPLTGRTRVWKLARYVAAATVFGEVAQDVRALLLRHDLIGDEQVEMNYSDIAQALSRASSSRRIPLNHPFWRAVQNIAYVGGIGIFQSVYENIHRRGGVETVLGPTVSRGADIKRDLVDPLIQGRPDDARYEAVLRRQIPTLLKRQVWDRVFGDLEAPRRGRTGSRSGRESTR